MRRVNAIWVGAIGPYGRTIGGRGLKFGTFTLLERSNAAPIGPNKAQNFFRLKTFFSSKEELGTDHF